MRILSVRPPVRPSVKRVHCNKLVERSVQIFIPYESLFSLHYLVFYLVCREDEWLVGGRPLLPEIFGQTDPIGAQMPIFNRYLPVAPQP